LNIVFLDRATFIPSVHFPKPNFEHHWTDYPSTAPHQIIPRLQQADIAITNKVVIDQAVLAHCPKLKYIAITATGMNVVDLDECHQRGIAVANVTNYATQGVAEHVFMLTLALCKQLKSYTQALLEGEWQRSGQFCFFLEDGSSIQTLHGKVLGLIGTGNIAQASAKLAVAFGMEVVYHSPSGRLDVNGAPCISLHQLLSMADVVSIHCPLTDDTRNLIGSDELALMKTSAILINSARGPIVDTRALIDALNAHLIAGAGLDVLPVEPPDSDSLEMQALTNKRLIITPHIAWASVSAMQALADQVVAKLNAHFTLRLE
jgi:glycerate dehydrogenase